MSGAESNYELHRLSDQDYELRDPSGKVLATYTAPVTVPNDVLDAILDDLGIANSSIRSAIKIVATGSIETIDDRGEA